jgi:Ca2+-binding RTX toxin-like protein
MVQHITVADSNFASAINAFNGVGPDFAFLIDANAYLISGATAGTGAAFFGAAPWTITVNGEIGTFAGGFFGINVAFAATLTIGKTGSVFGDTGARGIAIGGSATIVNLGTVAGDTSSITVGGLAHITNAGTLVGDVFVTTLGGDDIFTNFKKINGVIKNGTVDGLIDLGGGADHFNGGAKAETVRDGGGADTYKFGGGNDTYIAVKIVGVDGADIVDGGKGVDTYDVSLLAVGFLTVNLTAHTTAGDVGSDTVTGFENVIGGNFGCALTGSSAANSLTGGAGIDDFAGLGGRDILTGSFGGDTFHFFSLTDSGTKASARDLITDFTQGGIGSDLIDLSTIDAKTGAGNPGNDVFTFIGVSSFSGTKGELRESYSGGNTIVSGDVNGDGKADFSIALQGHFLLTGAGDFFL